MKLFSLLYALVLTSGHAFAKPNVTVSIIGGGTLEASSVVAASDGIGVNVYVRARGTNSVIVAVEATTPEIIRTIWAEPNTPNTDLQLIVRPKSGTSGRVLRLETIEVVDFFSSAGNGELFVSEVTTSATVQGGEGNIGYPGTTRGGLIDAHVIGTLHAAGHITASISTRTRLNTQDASSISLVRADGDLLGDIIALDGEIIDVLVEGNIGAQGNPASPLIWCSGNTKLIRADRIYASISNRANGGTGAIQSVRCTVGDFGGTLLTTDMLRLFGPQLNEGLLVAGDVTGSVNIVNTSYLPVAVSGQCTGTMTFGTLSSDGGSISIGSFPAAGPNGTPTIIVNNAVNAPISISGTLAGALKLNETGSGSINANVTIGGFLDGTLSTHGSLLGGRTISVASGIRGVLSIGDNLAGTISMPTNGLIGQVIANADNGGGTWTGTVRVGPPGTTPLATGNYSTPSSSLGGGAVGVSRFQLYGSDCTPVNSVTQPNVVYVRPLTATNPVRVRHYGPVRTPGTGLPVKVEYFDGVTWLDVSACFAANVKRAGDSGISREVGLYLQEDGPLLPFGVYRVTPIIDALNANRLMCDLVVGAPPVQTYDYRFLLADDCNQNSVRDDIEIAGNPILDCDENGRIDSCDVVDRPSIDGNGNGIPDKCEEDPLPCACDWNHQDGLDSQDYFDFLNGFFSGNADFNQDDVTDSQDYFDFLNCFFDGCE